MIRRGDQFRDLVQGLSGVVDSRGLLPQEGGGLAYCSGGDYRLLGAGCACGGAQSAPVEQGVGARGCSGVFLHWTRRFTLLLQDETLIVRVPTCVIQKKTYDNDGERINVTGPTNMT